MASVVVEFEDQPLERVCADLVVVGYSPDDRPLRGAAGRADWRLCGELWKLVTTQKLNGALGQAALLSAAGPLRSPLLLVVGLGHRAELDVDAWRALGNEIARRALDLQLDRVVLGLAADAACLRSEGTCALFAGTASAAAERRAGIHLVIAGDEMLVRLSELRSLAEAGSLTGVSLKLPETTRSPAKRPPVSSGGFTYDQGLRFK
jgi:hypothetical protein